MKQTVIFFFLLIWYGALQGQEPPQLATTLYRFLDFDRDLPSQWLTGRSVVFVSTPPKSRGGTDWKKLAHELHTTLKEAGVDAVAYYELADLQSSSLVAQDYAQRLAKREVEYLILLEHMPEEQQYSLIVAPFNQKATFFEHGTKAMLWQDRDLSKMMIELARHIQKTEPERTNFLIIDQPEFFYPSPIVSSRRYERFNPDLALDKLAIPRFDTLALPEGINRPSFGPWVRRMEAHNTELTQRNTRLENLMSPYPFPYEVVYYDFKNEELMRRQGFQFVLMYLHGPNAVGRNCWGMSPQRTAWRGRAKPSSTAKCRKKSYHPMSWFISSTSATSTPATSI
ncbi:MAG: hypothetical protein HC842_05230 [Cytophagales bacterium]|nr:hypothetical protein [Cytophagales bacterium]